jgi:hypothetical protein
VTCRKASEDDNRQSSKILIAMLLLSVAWNPRKNEIFSFRRRTKETILREDKNLDWRSSNSRVR